MLCTRGSQSRRRKKRRHKQKLRRPWSCVDPAGRAIASTVLLAISLRISAWFFGAYGTLTWPSELPPQSRHMGLSENRIPPIPTDHQDFLICYRILWGLQSPPYVPSGTKDCWAPCKRFRQQVAPIPRWSQGATFLESCSLFFSRACFMPVSIWDTTGSAHAKWEGLSIYFDIYIYINRYRYRYMYILMCIYIYDVLNCWSRVSQRGDHTARVAMCQSNIGAGAKGCCKGAFPKHHFVRAGLQDLQGFDLDSSTIHSEWNSVRWWKTNTRLRLETLDSNRS